VRVCGPAGAQTRGAAPPLASLCCDSLANPARGGLRPPSCARPLWTRRLLCWRLKRAGARAPVRRAVAPGVGCSGAAHAQVNSRKRPPKERAAPGVGRRGGGWEAGDQGAGGRNKERPPAMQCIATSLASPMYVGVARPMCRRGARQRRLRHPAPPSCCDPPRRQDGHAHSAQTIQAPPPRAAALV
jgi:hypothetical protein